MSRKLEKELMNYCTQKEAAEAIGKSDVTIWTWIKSGKLPAIKVGREVLIRKDDLAGLNDVTKKV